MNGRLPRQGPSTVRRGRLEEWLGRFKNVPVRFVIAPPGFGKTMALLGYLRHCAPNGYYCALAPGSTKEALWNAVAAALGESAGFTSQEKMLRSLVARAPLELAIDCADVPDAGAIAAMLHVVEDVPDGVGLLIACRSRVAFHVREFVSRGLASLCDAERLAFSVDEVRHLAETCGVRFVHADIVRFLELTEGWPLVVTGALCKAAEDSRNLREAFENWRTRRGHFFNEFIAASLAHVSDEHAALVRTLMTGSQLDDLQQFQALEEEGLFVIHTAGGYRPLRALSRSRLHHRFANALPPAPMQVRLFGWFQAEIGGRAVEWIRRRDRQIFEYVALQGESVVARAELAEVFWPETEKHLASQSLRSACSNIRKAIARLVGFDQVDAYFRTGNHEVSIDLDNVEIDVKRFLAHANDGDDRYERDEPAAALTHYRAARSLYSGSLLIADAKEPWVAAQAAILEQRHAAVLERLGLRSDVRLATG